MNANIEIEVKKMKGSFPEILEAEIENLLLLISINSKHCAHWGYVINVENQFLEIPNRIYWEEHRLREPRDLSKLSRTILACILTRHHSGYIREKYLNQIITSNEYWVMPYLVQLLGEYVIELLELIWINFEAINSNNLKRFIVENEPYWFKTKQRIASYWDCYYKHKFLNKEDYVGFKLIKIIEKLVNET